MLLFGLPTSCRPCPRPLSFAAALAPFGPRLCLQYSILAPEPYRPLRVLSRLPAIDVARAYL